MERLNQKELSICQYTKSTASSSSHKKRPVTFADADLCNDPALDDQTRDP